jgi:hypothetical protein
VTVDDMAPVWHTDRTAEHTRLLFPQPGRLLNVNQRVHWSVRSRVTRQWRTSAHQVALMLGTPRQRVHGVSWVRLIIPVPTRARRDPGNLYLLTKASVDGLVDAGVWPDDTHAFVETLEPRLIHIPRTKGIVPTIELVIVPRTGDTP